MSDPFPAFFNVSYTDGQVIASLVFDDVAKPMEVEVVETSREGDLCTFRFRLVNRAKKEKVANE